MTASSNRKPGVVHQSDINTELAPQDIYSGMYARVTINFYGYNQRGRRGIGCGLGNVMKTRDGEPLAGGATAAMDFAGIGQTVSTPAPATAPQGYPMPNYGAAMPDQMPYQNTGMSPQPVYGAFTGLQPGAINPLTGQPLYGG